MLCGERHYPKYEMKNIEFYERREKETRKNVKEKYVEM